MTIGIYNINLHYKCNLRLMHSVYLWGRGRGGGDWLLIIPEGVFYENSNIIYEMRTAVQSF